MFNNPLIERYRYSVMRPSVIYIYLSIYISLMAIIIFIGLADARFSGNFDGFFKGMFIACLIIELILLWGWASYNSGSVIREEIAEKSYSFFRLLPLSANQKTSGILVGKNLAVLVLAGINTALVLVFGAMARIDINLQIQTYLFIACITLFASSFALLASFGTPKKKIKSHPGVIVLVFAIFAMGPLIGIVGESVENGQLQSFLISFFTLKAPVLIISSLIAIYFSCWIIKGIFRKFDREREPLFTRWGALVFLAGYTFIALGLFFPKLGNEKFLNGYLITTILAIAALPMGSMRSYDDYLEKCGTINGSGASLNMRRIFRQSNLTLYAGLFAIWAAVGFGAAAYAGEDMAPWAMYVGVMLTFYAIFILLLELYVVYKPKSEKIGALVAFMIGLDVVVPMVLAGVLDKDTLLLFSPAGFAAACTEADNYTVWAIVAGFNIVISGLIASLVYPQYLNLLLLRRSMKKTP
ncbi:MAG: hypothetical protein PHF37_07835 [Phycisphaerae bacterium]|nr:hypothetical protein [Phycisphaerae bacterium]